MALGPVLGGWLVDHVSWRWVFYINVPLAVLVLAILFLRVPESRHEGEAQGLDWAGAFTIVIAFGGIVFALIESANLGLSHPVIMGSFGIGVGAMILFVFLEGRVAAPMLPMFLLRSPAFRGANSITLLLYAAIGGAMFFFPFNLIQVQGYSATASGAAFLPFILIMFLLSRWSGGIVSRYGARLPLVVGPLITAVGFGLFILPGIGGSY